MHWDDSPVDGRDAEVLDAPLTELDAVSPGESAIGSVGAEDPVAEAVKQAGAGRPAPTSALTEAEQLATAADPRRALAGLLALVERHPLNERLQVLAVRAVERNRDRRGAMPAWRSLLQRFPRCHDAMLLNLRWITRNDGVGPATQALAGWFPEQPVLAPDMLLLARALEELGLRELADAAFDRLMRMHPGYENGWLSRIRMEEQRGRPWQALTVAQEGVLATGARPRLRETARRLAGGMSALDCLLPPDARAGAGDVASLVLERLVERAAANRRAPPITGDSLGQVVMIGATLGAGGAERQMVVSAIGLQRAHRFDLPVGGRRIAGVEVICRAVEGRPAAAFFAPDLARNQVDLRCYAQWPDGSDGLDTELRDLLRFLPPRVAEATSRLTMALRTTAPGVVHLWQDGTILACSLAALLAGVPRIVLSVRTAPPQDRPERASPEYARLYPLLARLPGVFWSTNSRFAAARYGQTIGMDPARFHVVPNGIAPLASRGSAAARALLAAFDSRCPPGFTVGAVMRMDENKRPLEFIECAARLLAARPDARFILVGDGPLRVEVEERAARLGGRILFTGRSAEVGFWLARMDALMSLSRHEGLPNVVLEAQLAGVPVVATPAGGTSEAMRDGETGFLLSDATTPSRDEAVALVLRIAATGGRKGLMGRKARRFVSENFSVTRMLEGTVASYVE